MKRLGLEHPHLAPLVALDKPAGVGHTGLNLVPLSKTLIEQSVGRGLRLPYGRRVGVRAVDRLNIIAHDKFAEIIEEANRPGSVIRSGLVIGRDIDTEARETLTVTSRFDAELAEPEAPEGVEGEPTRPPATVAAPNRASQPRVFDTPLERQIARTVKEAITERFTHLPTSEALLLPEVRDVLLEAGRRAAEAAQRQDETSGAPQRSEPADVARVVATVTGMFMERTIDIPLIKFVPIGQVTGRFEPFGLELSSVNLQPVSQHPHPPLADART